MDEIGLVGYIDNLMCNIFVGIYLIIVVNGWINGNVCVFEEDNFFLIFVIIKYR